MAPSSKTEVISLDQEFLWEVAQLLRKPELPPHTPCPLGRWRSHVSPASLLLVYKSHWGSWRTNYSLLGARRTMLVVVFFSLALLGATEACKGHSTSFTQTGIVCRITRPATLVLNQETTKVIQRAFQRATYPDIKGERIMFFMGKINYGLHNIQISNLSISSSQVELKKDKSIDITIQNVSVIFRGTLQYGYHGGWLISSLLNSEKDCAADINSGLCSLHVKHLMSSYRKDLDDMLEGRENELCPTFICRLGVLTYKNQSSILPDSTYNPNLLGESRMLYFWFSDKVLSSLAKAAFLDKRLMLTLSGDEFKALLQDKGLDTNQDILREIFQHSSFSDSQVEIRSSTAPQITCQPEGTTVKSSVSVEIRLLHQDRAPTVAFSFEEDIVTVIQASYEDKKLILDLSDFQIHHKSFRSASTLCTQSQESIQEFLKTLTAMVGIPAVISWLEPKLTTLLNSKGLDLFDIINPEIITQKGYLLLQMDFGFPQHLLEDFLQTII
ncbi:cholesteryl ester transfer protein [Gracilinanus agilis]|uniref:cholesteryl ester transfer protein n=1 Tax=Gracilinanus agilis TaxID=191870 RepID=UPI001CFC867E|nr:cholesteryl ester transfer protein [Gracilinanus agilis]